MLLSREENKNMKILIIRHGDPDYAKDSLTEKGWREAELLSQRLIKMKIDNFYCSPLGRAKDTAKPTLEKLNREAEILPWLAEFRGSIINPATGKKDIPWNFEPEYWTKKPELFDKNNWLLNERMQSGNVTEIFLETISGIDELLLRHGYKKDGYIFDCDNNSDKTIAIFCHFALGSAVLGYILGISPSLLWQSTFLPPTSVTTLISEERTKGQIYFRCMQMGDTSHLYVGNEPVSTSGLFPEMYNFDN